MDRNVFALLAVGVMLASLSARRAWIEIKALGLLGWLRVRRSPQGERG